MNRLLFAALVVALAPSALAQPDPPMSTSPSILATLPADLTDAERAVAETIEADGIHVVHFWAPWCDNSIAELRAGWYEAVEQHPDVTFTFVTAWNDGESGREAMTRFGLPERVAEVTQPDFGPSDDKEQRRRRFLGLPMTWIPATWVFRNNGELATAFNYGEIDMDQLARAIEGARSSWPHD